MDCEALSWKGKQLQLPWLSTPLLLVSFIPPLSLGQEHSKTCTRPQISPAISATALPFSALIPVEFVCWT